MYQKIKQAVTNVLRWSERYTKTDMIYLMKGGGMLSASTVFSILGGLALATAFANLVPQETYGTYKFVVSAASIIGGFTLSGMGTAVAQAVANGYEGSLRFGAKKKLQWSVGVVIVALGVALYYYLQDNQTLAAGMAMIAAFYPLRTSFGVYENYLVGKKDFKRKSIYSVLLESTQISVMVATLFLTNNVLWVLLAFFTTNMIASLFFYFFTLKTNQPENNKVDENMLPYSKHLSIIKIFQKIARHIDKVLVWHYLGAVQLAIYSFAQLPVTKIQNLIGPIEQVAFPKLSEKNLKTLQRTLNYKVVIFAVVLLAGSGVYILSAPYIFNLLFPAYLESVTYTQVYALGIVLFAGQMYEKTLEAQAQTRWLYISRVASNVIKIVLLLVLLPIYGIWGAIISLLGWRLAKGITAFVGFKVSEPNKDS